MVSFLRGLVSNKSKKKTYELFLKSKCSFVAVLWDGHGTCLLSILYIKRTMSVPIAWLIRQSKNSIFELSYLSERLKRNPVNKPDCKFVH